MDRQAQKLFTSETVVSAVWFVFHASVRSEVGLIFPNAMRKQSLPPADKSYPSQVVSAKAGISEPVAAKRVDDAFTAAWQAADDARKAVAHSMYWTFLALLVGAFCASFAATIGGKQRDLVVVV